MKNKRIYEACATVKGNYKTVHNYESPTKAVEELLNKYPNIRTEIRVSYVHESNVSGMVISCFQAPVIRAKKKDIFKLIDENIKLFIE